MERPIINSDDGRFDRPYVAFSGDGRSCGLFADSSHRAYMLAVEYFKPPKSKRHLVSVHLADVVHAAVN